MLRLLFVCIWVLSSFSLQASSTTKTPSPPKHAEKPSETPPPSDAKEPPIPDLPTVPPSEEMTDSYQHAFFKMLSSLAILLALLFATVWFLRRLKRGKFHLGSHKTIEILERRSLSPKTVLYLLDIEGKKILVSESQIEVRTLTSLEKQESEK